VQQLPGGSARRLTADPAEAGDPSVSPDGRSVAFRSERNGGGIYVMDTAGGNERLFAREGRTPQFSPDGQRVVYWTGDPDEGVPSGRIYVRPVGGGPATRLATDFEDARLPSWSSDGRFLLFQGCRSQGQPLLACSDWWVMSADGARFVKTGAMAILRQQQIMPRDDTVAWQGNHLIFGATHEDSYSLWELAISERNLRATGRVRQLTTGDGGETGVTIAQDGSIAFGRLSAALHIWRLDRAPVPHALSAVKITGETAVDISPSVSRNGLWLVFGRGSRSHRDIWVKDLRSGTETRTVVSKYDKASPLIDDSGTIIVYEQREPEGSTISLASAQSQRKLCTGCSNPTGWFGDGEAFFYSGSLSSKIMVMDPRRGTSRIAVDGGSASVGGGDWSPANQYLLFTASADGSRKQIFAVRFPGNEGQPAGDWDPVTGESEWSDRPRWSGDGKMIYYLSNRDGYYCIWRQQFDPVRGKVKGAAVGVAHYHNPRISPDRVRRSSFGMAVSGDSVFLNLGEVRDSVWTGELRTASMFHLRDTF
jgi:eukaryotic-like serine/threonine-protein kinase